MNQFYLGVKTNKLLLFPSKNTDKVGVFVGTNSFSHNGNIKFM
jgi:hypothetical protein